MNSAYKTAHLGLIDYAGLFPPASLNLEEALKNYIGYQSCDQGWMLGSFILPADKIADTATILEKIAPGVPLTFSLLPSSDLAGDIAAFKDFSEKSAHEISLQALEFLVPESADPFEFTTKTLAITGEQFAVYFEKPASLDLNTFNKAVQRVGAGVKLRCGGVDTSMIPSLEEVTETICNCVAKLIPLKFTAGLHHPVRHFSKANGAMLHGFTNVFTATMLCRSHKLSRERVLEILSDENPNSFKYNLDTLQWKELTATQENLANARAHVAHSYGSCSFDEPIHDLIKLGWMNSLEPAKLC